MGCLGFDLSGIYVYAALCGLFTGAAGARLIRGPVRTGGKGISALVPLYLSLALLAALAGFFFGGGYPGPVVFIPFGILAGLALISATFRRAGGIPVFIVSAGLLLSVGYTFRPWSCVSSGQELIRLQLLSRDEEGMKLESETPGEMPVITEIPRDTVILRAEVLRVHPAWFFIRRTIFFKTTLSDPLPDAAEAGFISNYVLSLPGFSILQYESEPLSPLMFVDYILTYDGETGFSLKKSNL